MTLPDILAIVAIALVVGGAVLYIVLAKKRGDKCVGCPYAKQCSGGCNCNQVKKNNNKKK